MDWQKIIKEVCDEHDISEYRLAKITGISQGYINKLSRGERHDPSINKAMQILKYHPDCWYVGNGKIKRVSGGKE